MTNEELEEAKQPTSVEKLLDEVDGSCCEDYQVTAYNYMIDYLENPDWFVSHEGQRLLVLSIEVLKNI